MSSTHPAATTQSATKAQIRAQWKRWADVLVLGLVSSGVAAYIVPKALCSGSAVRELPRWPVLAPCCIGILLLIWRRIWPWLGLRHAFSYPPTWFASVFGLLFLFGGILLRAPVLPEGCYPIWYEDPALSAYWLVITGSVLALIAVIPCLFLIGDPVVDCLRRSWKRPAPPVAPTFLEWLASDAPIRTREEDRFDLAPVVDQMTALLTGPGTPSVALIGQLGAGKTSVRDLVTRCLNPRTHRIVHIGLWPYESVDAAIAGVLRGLTTALAAFTSTEILTWVPEDYVDLIEDVAGPWKKLIRFGRSDGPGTQLKRIDQIGVALGIKIILWVEDLERFSGMSESTQQPEYLRLGPLRALLGELSQLQSVQVVLASSAVDSRFDLEKLAQHVLTIPTPDRALVARTVRQHRDMLLSRVWHHQFR